MSELKAMAAGLDAVEKALLRPCPPDEEDWIAERAETTGKANGCTLRVTSEDVR